MTHIIVGVRSGMSLDTGIHIMLLSYINFIIGNVQTTPAGVNIDIHTTHLYLLYVLLLVKKSH